MNTTLNTSIIVFIFFITGIYFLVKYYSYKTSVLHDDQDYDPYTLEALIDYVMQRLHELIRTNPDDMGLGEETYRRKVSQRRELRRALKGCVSGDIRDKTLVKNQIRDLLLSGYGLVEQHMDQIIPFEQIDKLSVQEKFDIMLYLFQSSHGPGAMETLIKLYELDRPRHGSNEEWSYEITTEDIHSIFYQEYRPLIVHEKLDIIVQRVYQQYKGFSVIDELRDQRIDGVSGGVSGTSDAESDFFNASQSFQGEEGGRNYESIWIFFQGKSIHLSFLSFGSSSELKRVCQNIYKYNLPGQLSQSNGYKVNEMKDGSRVVVVRPPFAESWAFFVRKFDVQKTMLDHLVQGDNADVVVDLLKYLMKGSRITAITGAQGSGKTTLMMAMIRHIYASYTLRVQEMSFELHLRNLYNKRNILSFKETEHISGQAGLDLQKKTDGAVNILGEVSTDEVATWMIQMAQVASLFTLFTHHAKTFEDLIYSLRNSLLKTGMFRDERIAENQVLHVIHFNVHLRADMNGRRYIERITECNHSATVQGGRNIIEHLDGGYKISSHLSPKSIRDMSSQMTDEDQVAFQQFVKSRWGEQIGA
ncbi:pilus assembly protein CpaF [Paenibacillus shirakamiensis]|uniref:Pilus assembly protein CpaF n=1 Tax=Paenibacillus shirakamiensis TaxID=1265935 RepID=A0ABS4JGV9_9BACL|nr:ATPase, T2SS/T4P/T4SS family [Paenibacillus shirakamiensis]MBP1999799.1 pilus assembly protein CpaF [Paenibacillus shirakamiensis]